MIATLQKEDSSKTITKILTTMKTAKATIITPFSKNINNSNNNNNTDNNNKISNKNNKL
jgi:hypothetical protein